MTNPPSSSALDEETARAELYGVIAELFYAPSRAELLAQLRVAATEAPAAGGFLEEPWRQLVGVAREMDDAAIQKEYDALFGGVGKPEVYAFASHFISGFLNEKPLATLRRDMAVRGITRAQNVYEPEDNIASLLEMMGGLVVGRFGAPATLSDQREFFNKHISPWAAHFFSDLEAAKNSVLYASVGAVGKAFMAIEAESFRMSAE